MNTKEAINKAISLHDGLKPVDIWILSNKVGDIYVLTELLRYPRGNISSQAARIIGQEW
jgi:hypothetical protein